MIFYIIFKKRVQVFDEGPKRPSAFIDLGVWNPSSNEAQASEITYLRNVHVCKLINVYP